MVLLLIIYAFATILPSHSFALHFFVVQSYLRRYAWSSFGANLIGDRTNCCTSTRRRATADVAATNMIYTLIASCADRSTQLSTTPCSSRGGIPGCNSTSEFSLTFPTRSLNKTTPHVHTPNDSTPTLRGCSSCSHRSELFHLPGWDKLLPRTNRLWVPGMFLLSRQKIQAVVLCEKT